MYLECLDFQGPPVMYVHVPNRMTGNNLNPLKGADSMAETLHDAAQAYLEHLRKQGKAETTLATYQKGALESANQ